MFERPQIEGNFRSKIDTAFAHGHANTLKRELSVGFAVADHDVAAAAPNQLIQSHIVEVAAIAKVYIATRVVCPAEQLIQQPQ